MSIKRFIASVVLLLSLFVTTANVGAQERKLEDPAPSAALGQRYWVTLGFGGVNIDDEFPVAYGTLGSFQTEHQLFSARIIGGNGTQANKLPHEWTKDVAIMYGYAAVARTSLWRGNLSLGLAYAWGARRVLDHEDPSPVAPIQYFRLQDYSAIGLAYVIQAFSKFSVDSGVGIGVTFCGDVNNHRSFSMLLVSLEFGVL